MLREFREFLMRGNVVELAVAFMIGIAFQAVVSSFAEDVLMNLIAAIFGQPDFAGLVVELNGTPIRYGEFLNAVVNLVIVAFALFLLVKGVARAKRLRATGEKPAATTQPCPFCKTGIPVDATRCPACTSHLDQGKNALRSS